MKILCVIESLEAGGAQRQLVGLASQFKSLGHEVNFLTYYDNPFYTSILESQGIEVNLIESRTYLGRVVKIRSFIRKGGYDSVLAFLETPSFICEIAGLPFRKWKLIVGERNANPKMLKAKKMKIFRFFHFFADEVVANSLVNIEMVKKVMPILPKNKFHVIYNMIDSNEWKPIKEPTRNVDSLFLEILVAGRHVPQKNLLGLIEALNLLPRKERDKIRIKWYGDKITPPYYDSTYVESLDLINKYDLNNIIKFYPATLKIKEKIQNSDVVGLFSIHEGFPNIVCEGMACGKPIIASTVSDIPLIIENPYLLFDPTDHQSIANVLSRIVNMGKQELKSIGGENRKIAIEKFDPINISNKYLKLLSNEKKLN
ncbi:glycosyltransferase family 4 protein [Belliella marina]|uniref:Glycosyltransferase family 4 protein n=1 Tax=Belliella marina TaxID=1644146 RepID=A0ABW4VQ55_9BACT